jgi:GMP synthase-like glutamine amidotransferase
VVEHEADAGASLMDGALGPAVQVVRPYLGDALPAVSQLSGLLVLGGSMGAWDDEIAPWLPAVRDLLRDAVRTGLPTLGICLGGQLLAAACAGTVERGGAGLEVGVIPVTPLPAADSDPFFGRVRRTLDGDWPVHQYHFDAVTRLPADAELKVTGDRYPHQGFRVGAAAWGVQYHPEVSTDLFTTWLEHGQSAGDLADAPDLLQRARDGATAQARVAAVHAGAFLEVVQGAAVQL